MTDRESATRSNETPAPDSSECEAARERTLLEGRARELAVVQQEAVGDDSLTRAITFSLAGNGYAIPLHQTLEVVPVADCTPVPGMPSQLLGLFNLRGTILPLFDVRAVVGNALTQEAMFHQGLRAIVLGRQGPELGFVTDGVDVIVELRPEDFISAPDTLRQGRDFVQGITKDGVVVVDGDMLLDDPRLILTRKSVMQGKS